MPVKAISQPSVEGNLSIPKRSVEITGSILSAIPVPEET